MGELRCTLKQAQDGVAVPLDESTTITVVPAVAQLTLKGRAFDSGRTFLLPRSVNALNEVFALATRIRAKHAVVVGHVDAGEPEPDKLSQTRAELAAAWLVGNTAPWLDQYGSGIAEAQRWGAREDKHLLSVALSGMKSAPPKPGETGDPEVRAFQTLARIKVDGIAGPVTRGKLLEKYFAQSRLARLPGVEPPENGITPLATKTAVLAAAHNFTPQQVSDAKKSTSDTADSTESSSNGTPPNAQGTSSADSASPSAEPEESAARIDFMLFFSDSGPDPAVGAADGPEFLEWVKQTDFQKTVSVDASGGNTLFIELWDKQIVTRHKAAKYSLKGPESFSGVTDSLGRIEHDSVTNGDYTLTLTLEFFEGKEKITDQYECSVLVQEGQRTPQVRFIGSVPWCELAQVKGLLFDTNKAFLVPEAITSLKDIRAIYERHNGSDLLVVGHTDTTASPSTNDPLSLERAKSTLAYLQDDVDGWLSFYETSVPEERRWGEEEDARMQEVVGNPSLTRAELIAAYMALDGVELDSAEFQIEAVAHGCGENFPLDDSGTELDTSPEDSTEDALDRRVELFFFNPEFGILPKPPGENSKKGSTQYPEWRKLAKIVNEREVFDPDAPRPDEVRIKLATAEGTTIPNERVLLRFPDGTEQEHRLDGTGTLTLSIGDAASVDVVFPDRANDAVTEKTKK
jgi:outer membrane protein OmpA-like peptidoglycan-associated protein